MPNSDISGSAISKLQNLPDVFEHINATEDKNNENLIDQVNDCFNSMVLPWQQGDYQKIIKQADELSLHFLCDIRICVYYLYSLWVMENVQLASLIIIFKNILNHEQRPWLATLESKPLKSSKILRNSIGLFFRKILTNLEVITHPDRNLIEDAANVIKSLDDFKSVVNEKDIDIGEDNHSNIRSLTEYFYSLECENEKNAVHLEISRNEMIGEPNANRGEIPSYDSLATHDHGGATTDSRKLTSDVICNRSLIDPALFNPSYLLQSLFRKISTLQALIDKQDNFKAAIVLADIQEELNNFNPLNYFPEYFSKFAGLRAKHVSDLEPYFTQQKTYQWQVLSEYYRTDMAAFVELGASEYSSIDARAYSENYMEGECND